MPISFSILIVVFCLIAIRQWLPAWVKIWHIMLGGAVLLLVCDQVSPMTAVKLVQWHIIGFLFGVFSIGSGLQETDLPRRLCQLLLGQSRPRWKILLGFMLMSAFISAIVTNDTVAIIATPLALLLAKATKVNAKLFLLALCFSITIGSALSPIGNPQNILITVQGQLAMPFIDFFNYLSVPVLLSLIICFLWLCYLFRRDLKQQSSYQTISLNTTSINRWPVLLSILLFLILLIYYTLAQFNMNLAKLSLGTIGLISCLPLYCFSSHRVRLVTRVDWSTLIFFIAMFIVMGTVWHSGIIQQFISKKNINLDKLSHIFIISTMVSQLISNMPLVELYLSYFGHTSIYNLMALSISSTFAGNLFIISAASTVIVIQQAESHHNRSITFWNFFAAGLPLTIITLLLSYIWFYCIPTF
ncbi:MAG: SLC13 family permease [Pseudomonadota bacterium]